MQLSRNSALVHFTDRSGHEHNYIFQDPKRVFQTDQLDEVLDCLQEAEEASRQGYYVVGFVAYEAARAFDQRFITKESSKLPLVWFAAYENAGSAEDLPDTSDKKYRTGSWSPDVSPTEYDEMITRIRQYIKEGVTYQTNYTIRLESDFHGDDFDLFQRLSKAQNTSYSAYINLGEMRILSVSPELFFEFQDGAIITRPMKGTAARGRWYEEDITYRENLRESVKDRAENIMIVDLLRNDLGRIAEPGTVKVSNLFEVEQFPTVHQMTSEITATTKASLTDIFTALFPCGSITGAPKVSTMEIIESVENSARGIYCGSIGLMLPDNHYIFNVAIRTVVVDTTTDKAVYGVGGGITWDSSAQGEYQEILNKSAILQQNPVRPQLVETMRLSQGQYELLPFHMERLAHSAAYFGYKLNEGALIEQLESIANHSDQAWMVRVLLSEQGDIEVQSSALPIQSGGADAHVQTISLSALPVHSSNPYLYHKTTNREVYTSRQIAGYYDTLLWNERNEITEFTRGNVVVKINDIYYTPPVESGLLQGTFRRQLLEQGEIVERIIWRDELTVAEEIWFINSVRGWVRTQLVDMHLIT